MHDNHCVQKFHPVRFVSNKYAILVYKHPLKRSSLTRSIRNQYMDGVLKGFKTGRRDGCKTLGLLERRFIVMDSWENRVPEKIYF